MSRLEFINFENEVQFKNTIKALLSGEDVTRTYKTKDGEDKTKLVCRKNRLYVGNNYSISVSKDNEGRVFVGIDYLSSDDRIQMMKLNNDSSNVEEF